jgi:hypothetical protein
MDGWHGRRRDGEAPCEAVALQPCCKRVSHDHVGVDDEDPRLAGPAVLQPVSNSRRLVVGWIIVSCSGVIKQAIVRGPSRFDEGQSMPSTWINRCDFRLCG